jgi:hypothetical protein
MLSPYSCAARRGGFIGSITVVVAFRVAAMTAAAESCQHRPDLQTSMAHAAAVNGDREPRFPWAEMRFARVFIELVDIVRVGRSGNRS